MTHTTQRNSTTRSDLEWLEKTNKWREAKRQLEKWKVEEDRLRQELIDLAKEDDTSGGGIRLTKSTRKGLVDYGMIPELNGVDLDKYRKPPITSWRIVLLEKL